MIAVISHEAIGGPAVVAGNPLVIVSGYLLIIVILVVFGVWGFRLGSRGSSGNPGGGGPKRPGPKTPPRGGRELSSERPPSDLDVSRAFEPADLHEQAQEREDELVAPGSRR